LGNIANFRLAAPEYWLQESIVPALINGHLQTGKGTPLS